MRKPGRIKVSWERAGGAKCHSPNNRFAGHKVSLALDRNDSRKSEAGRSHESPAAAEPKRGFDKRAFAGRLAAMCSISAAVAHTLLAEFTLMHTGGSHFPASPR